MRTVCLMQDGKIMSLIWKPSDNLKGMFSSLPKALGKVFIVDVATRLEQQVADAALVKYSGFWQKISKSVKSSIKGNIVEIYSTHPAALMRDKGGRISAKNQDWLTIPVNDSKNRSYRQMKAAGWKIFRIPGPDGGYLLGNRGKGTRTALLFILRRSVLHPAAHWIPTENQLFKTVQQVFSKVTI